MNFHPWVIWARKYFSLRKISLRVPETQRPILASESGSMSRMLGQCGKIKKKKDLVKCKQLSAFQTVLGQERSHDDQCVPSPRTQAQKSLCQFWGHMGPSVLCRRWATRPAFPDINHNAAPPLLRIKRLINKVTYSSIYIHQHWKLGMPTSWANTVE